MLEVLQVIGDGSPGGGTTAVLLLSHELSRRGVSVTIASQHSSHIIEQARRRGLRIFELEFGKRHRSRRVTQSFANYLRMSPPTVVHAHGARAGLPVAMLSRDAAASRVYTVHGFHYREKPIGVRHMAKMVERFCIRRSNATVFVSNGDAKIARQEGLIDDQDHSHIIRNGCPEADTAIIPESPKYDIAFLGRLHFQKNPLILPEILTAMRPARPSLCIIGSGEYEDELRRRIKEAGLSEQVTFCGAQPHAQALDILASSRVMLLPSRWEGLPISVVEAMHRGIPVVASNIPGTDELIVDAQTGYLVDRDDVVGYADRLNRLLVHEDLRRGMGRAALRQAREQFSLEPLVTAYLSLYHRVYNRTDRAH